MRFCQCCKLAKGIVCNKCEKKKSTDCFYVGKKICKECRKEYNKEKYQAKKLANKNVE
jgi:hypothetical protein